MAKVIQRGNFEKIESFLDKMLSRNYLYTTLKRYGQAGVDALSAATPVDTGLTASSWRYEIEIGKDSSSITFYNTNVNNGVNIAVILDEGHGTRNGGYVQGRKYINPTIQPIFDNIAEAAWRAVVDS